MKTITGTVVDAQQNPIANGTLRFRLFQRATVVATNIVAPTEILVSLNANGAIPANTQIYASDELSPQTAYYANVYSSSGQFLFGELWLLTGSSPIDVTGIVPTSNGVGVVTPITSVGLSMPAEFSVSGSPLAAPGTITVSKATETANTVWAGPTTGAATVPAFRALVDADVAGVTNLRTNVAVPSGPDTLVGKVTTDTLKNKTLTGAGSGNSTTLLSAQYIAGNITGTGADATMFSYVLPANTLQAGKGLRITLAALHAVGTASVTYKIKFGVTAVQGVSTTAGSGDVVTSALVFNNSGVQNAQTALGQPGFIGSTFLGGTGATLPAENTANAVTILGTFSVANTDQVRPTMMIVELIQ